MAAHPGYQEVVVLQGAYASYLVSSGTGGSDTGDILVELANVTADHITLSDFV